MFKQAQPHSTCGRLPDVSRRCRSKYRAHAGHLHPSHTSVLGSAETYGNLGEPITRYLRTLIHRVSRGSFLKQLLVPTGNCVWLLYKVRVMCTALAHCCSPRLGGGRFWLGRTFPPFNESSVVYAAPVYWLCRVLLRLAKCCLGVSGCLQARELAFLPCCSFCLLPAPLSIVAAFLHRASGFESSNNFFTIEALHGCTTPGR
jgi:hypothetical protein